MSSELNRLVVRGVPIPTLELDPDANAVYIRFSKAKVVKTIPDERQGRGTILAVDLDSKGEMVGIEVVGVKTFSLRAIRRALPERWQRDIDLDSAPLSLTPA